MREDLIPGIVILLQKQWRGTLCRQRFQKMKALMAIMNYYRRYKMRQYITQLSLTFRYFYYHFCGKNSKSFLKIYHYSAETRNIFEIMVKA